ncbi:MAG: hypothetical protein HUJ61_08610, partial [Bacilli bacterium]|nr:hypothetical protein [Bacilli bacterium]
AYGWFSIYFFTIPYRELAQTTKTYNSIIDAEQVEEILVVKEIVNDYQKERNLITLVKLVDEQGNDRVLYLLKPIELSKNTKYKFVSKANYIVSYEVKK